MTEFPIDQPDPAEITEEIEAFARGSSRLRETEEVRDVTQIVDGGGEGIRTYIHEIAGQRVERLWPPTDDLEQGGIWHTSGTLPCATGQPYPHNNTPECRMVDRPAATFREQREAFELPTVAALRHQIDQLTVDRQALQAVITELQAELGEAQAEVAAMHRIAEGLDQARITLAMSAHGLLGALDEGDLDTPGFIERMREALAAVETSNIRMGLTDKAREILGPTPGASADGSVPDVAREDSSDPDTAVDVKGAGESITPSVTHPTRSMHKGHYGVPETGKPGEAPEPHESGTTERYMMATLAYHQLGEISRAQPDLVLITGEDDNHWIGSWVEGLGYFNVRFPKATTRGLTDDEVQAYDGSLLDVGASRYVIRIPAGGEDGPQ